MMARLLLLALTLGHLAPIAAAWSGPVDGFDRDIRVICSQHDAADQSGDVDTRPACCLLLGCCCHLQSAAPPPAGAVPAAVARVILGRMQSQPGRVSAATTADLAHRPRAPPVSSLV